MFCATRTWGTPAFARAGAATRVTLVLLISLCCGTPVPCNASAKAVLKRCRLLACGFLFGGGRLLLLDRALGDDFASSAAFSKLHDWPHRNDAEHVATKHKKANLGGRAIGPIDECEGEK